LSFKRNTTATAECSMTNVYWHCPKDGDVFIHRGAGLTDIVDAEKLEPLIEGVEKPKLSDDTVCPICGHQWDMATDIQIRDE
jgi:hypothetical protein